MTASNMIDRILDRKYRLRRKLGQGGMGAVYEAEHILLSHRVAVKVLTPDSSARAEQVERLILEAQAASAIGHPNIVKALDFGEEEDGTVFIVMELLKGESLERLIGTKGALSPERTVSIILQVLSALCAAHPKGIIHRDLKPDNVFLSIDARMREEVKLLDFGVAKFLTIEGENMKLTDTGAVLGTPYYLAPEQARGGKDIDARIDIWSVGVMMYEMLSGRLPFPGDNYNEVIAGILLKQVPPLKKVAPRVPEKLAEIVDKCLEKDRDKRFESVAKVIEALLPFYKKAPGVMSEIAESALENSVVVKSPYYKEEEQEGPRGEGRKAADLQQTEEAPPEAPKLPELQATMPDRPREMKSKASVKELKITVSERPPPESEKGPRRPEVHAPPRIPFGFQSYFGKSRKGVAAVSLVIIATVMMGLILSFSSPEPESHQAEDREKSPEKAGEPAAESDAVGDGRADGEAKQITIVIRGAPADAEIRLEDKVVSRRFEVAKSDTPINLSITAPGYMHYERELLPDMDKTVMVSLEKQTPAESAASRPAKKADKSAKKSAKKKKGRVWTANPFD